MDERQKGAIGREVAVGGRLGRELIKHPPITLLMQLNKGYVVRCQLVIARRELADTV
jgi:hypothetical protein